MTATADEPQARQGSWLPAGEEPHPTGSIAHHTVLRCNGTSLLCLPGGDIDAASEPSTGLYHADCRYLSRLLVTFGGVAPILLDAHDQEHGLTAILTNPAMVSPSELVVPAQTLVVRRKRVLTEGLAEALTVSNYSREPVDLELRIELGADFRDIFEIRGYEREGTAPTPTAEATADEVVYRYTGSDGVKRRTNVRFRQPPERLSDSEAVYHMKLEPRGTEIVEFEVSAGRDFNQRTVEAAERRVADDQRAWLSRCACIETDNPEVDEMLRRSFLDIHALMTDREGERYLAAGVPWYDTLFGRDSLIAGIEMLPFAPEVLRCGLRALAREQATHTDPVHDATPGKIPHELRWSELANSGEVPFGRYYGSVDATPLFIVAAWEYLRWTVDRDTIEELWPALKRAYEWCVRESTRGVEGCLSYQRRSERGLENQGWKDSHDAICWPDGRLVDGPISLVEVQAYLSAALSAYERLSRFMGEPFEKAAALASKAARWLDDLFGHDELGYVLCLDGDGKPVPTPASNAGHVLWMGVARKDRAVAVGRRLMRPDMFSGWGVRTLSTTVGGFNPLGYHVGSVWPHDNALLLAGFRWYGLEDEAERLSTALVQMALAFPQHRVPELFSGDSRELRHVPTPYPVASRPQAWAAASLPFVFASMLGLRPGRGGQLHVVRPRLPAQLRHLRIKGLKVGGGSVDLFFRRTGNHASVEVEDIRGLEVVLAGSWPEEGDGGDAGKDGEDRDAG